MFGYEEPLYTTVTSKIIVRHNVSMQIERRKPDNTELRQRAHMFAGMGLESEEQLQQKLERLNEAREYIVILGNDEPQYLFYTYGNKHDEITLAEAQERLNEDWNTLSSDPDINIKRLRWCELIYADIGRTDLGCTSMY